jgi:lipopolysaccharide export LptBFGC system permease protein LptF
MDDKWVYDKADTYVINENAKIDALQVGHLNDSTLNNLMKISLNSPKSLKFKDLAFMIHFYNKRGLKTILYKLALYKKISYPLSVVALVVLMVSLCVQYSMHFSYVFMVSKVLIFGFIYWIILTVCESLGKSGLINPFYAVFLPVIMCFVASVCIILKKNIIFKF